MESESDFVDYYDLLQVDFHADARKLEIAYHFFAKLFHPDNADTADVDKFGEVVTAYQTLRDPAKREKYNQQYVKRFGRPPNPAAAEPDLRVDEDTAYRDDEAHAQILFALYKQRRAKATSPGVGGWLLQEKLGCDENQFDFYVWYLKAKKLVEITEEGQLAITIAGVEHVISMSRETKQKQLLLGKSADDPTQA